MRLPIFNELSTAAKDYFRGIGEYVGEFFSLSLYKELGEYAEQHAQPLSTEKRNIVRVHDEKLLKKVKPCAEIALQYLGHTPEKIQIEVMLDGGTRPIRLFFTEKGKEYAAYLKLAEPTSVLLRDLYKNLGDIHAPYQSVVNRHLSLEQEIQGKHSFELPKKQQDLPKLKGYTEAIMSLDACRIFAGFGDLAKSANTVFVMEEETVKGIIPIDFNVSQIYNDTDRKILKIARQQELQLDSKTYDNIYAAQKKRMKERIVKRTITPLLKAMKSMPELEGLASYIKQNQEAL